MNNSIQQYLIILGDNDYKAQYSSVPDYVDNRDEMLAEIHENMEDDGLLPDSLRFFEVNGFSESSELKKYLNTSFEQFRIEFHAGNHCNNQSLIKEIESRINGFKENIGQLIFEASQIKDNELNNLLNIKANYCNDLMTFINTQKEYSNKPDANSIQKNIKKPKTKKEKHSYKWLKSSEELENLFSEMIKKELIAKNTQWDDFKIIFSNKPISSINKPVHWEEGTKLFAYFFIELKVKRYIPEKASWILLDRFFTYNNDDEVVTPIYEGVKSYKSQIEKSGKPDGYELVDKVFASAKDLQ